MSYSCKEPSRHKAAGSQSLELWLRPNRTGGSPASYKSSWTSVTKLSKGENVSMEVLMKVCKALECNIGDIMDLIPEEGDVNVELKEE